MHNLIYKVHIKRNIFITVQKNGSQWKGAKSLQRPCMNFIKLKSMSEVNTFDILKEPNPIFKTFGDFHIENPYFSHKPWSILQLKSVPFGRY